MTLKRIFQTLFLILPMINWTAFKHSIVLLAIMCPTQAACIAELDRRAVRLNSLNIFKNPVLTEIFWNRLPNPEDSSTAQLSLSLEVF